MPVNPAERAFFEMLIKRAEEEQTKPVEEQSLEEFREGVSIFAEFSEECIDINSSDSIVLSRDGYSIPIRIYNPDKTGPALIFYPGTGYIIDLFEANGTACSRIAKFSDSKVILINYRLAPEFPLPTAIYDAYDATKFIVTHANEFGIDPTNIVIGGISSGAHCAAVISNLARKDSDFKIHQQILINGYYDSSQSQYGFNDYEAEDLMLSGEAMSAIINFQKNSAANFINPLLSPILEQDLSGLPNTTMLIGEYDGLRSDSEAYCKKLTAAGNRVERILLQGQTHNPLILRKAMTDGEDPAKTIADVFLKCT